MAAYCGTEHAIGCASGSDALLLSLLALGVGPGDEVIVPSFTFFATASAVWRLGAKPVFADIRPDTFNLDPADVLYKLTTATKAIIPVHLFGQCAEMDEIRQIATAARGIPIIEDACQAIGAEYRGRRAGSLGHDRLLQLLSDEEPGRLRRRRTHHDERRRAGREAPRAARSRPAAAVLSSLRRPQQPARCAAGGGAEREAAEARRLGGRAESACGAVRRGIRRARPRATRSLRRPWPRAAATCGTNTRCACIDGRRDALQKYLADRKIGSAIYYPVPLHLQKCFAALGYEEGSLPVTEQACREVLSLPVYPELTAAEQGDGHRRDRGILPRPQAERQRENSQELRVECREPEESSDSLFWLSTLDSDSILLVLRLLDFVRAASRRERHDQAERSSRKARCAHDMSQLGRCGRRRSDDVAVGEECEFDMVSLERAVMHGCDSTLPILDWRAARANRPGRTAP